MQMKYSMKKHIKMRDHQTRTLTAEMVVEASTELSFSAWLPSLSTQKTLPSTFRPALRCNISRWRPFPSGSSMSRFTTVAPPITLLPEKWPSYSGVRATLTGPIVDFAFAFRRAETGDSVNSRSIGPFVVNALTSNFPPVAESEVSVTTEVMGLIEARSAYHVIGRKGNQIATRWLCA